MKKQRRQFLVLLILILIGAAAYAGLTIYNSKQAEKEAEEEESSQIHFVSFAASDVESFSYNVSDTEYVYTKADGEWTVDSNESMNLDEDSVDSLLSDLNDMTADSCIGEDADPSDYCFDNPMKTIEINTSADTITVTIGEYNDILGLYYVMVSGDDNIYLVSSDIYNSFNSAPENFEAEEESVSDDSASEDVTTDGTDSEDATTEDTDSSSADDTAAE